MQQFIHLPANIQCTPQRSKQTQHPFPIGYLEIRFLQQTPGLPVVYLSLAICGTWGSIQVWSLQVTITALLLLLWRSSSFVSSRRSPCCSAEIPVPIFFLNSTSTGWPFVNLTAVLYTSKNALSFCMTSSSCDHLISQVFLDIRWSTNTKYHMKTVRDKQNVFLVDTTNICLKMHAYVFTPVCWGAIFDVSCSVFTFVVESVVINC